MISDENRTRRSALKSIAGASGGLVTIRTLSGTGSAGTLEPTSDLDFDKEIVTTEGDLDWVGGDLVNIHFGSQIVHHHSFFSSDEGAWFHRITHSTCATSPASRNDPDGELKSRHQGQRFEIYAPADIAEVLPRTADEGFTVFPDGEDSVVPYWTKPVFEALISEAVPGTGFAFAANEIREKSDELPEDDVTTVSGGFGYRNTSGWFSDWEACSHLHDAYIREESDSLTPIIYVDFGFVYVEALCCREWVDYSNHFVRGDWLDDSISADRLDHEMSIAKIDLDTPWHPEKMSEMERQKIGIRRYVGDERVEVDGNMIRPTYITTTSPFVQID